MKNVLITGGPTIEPIDEVMKITNFSTGSMSVGLSESFLDKGYRVTLIVNHIVNTESIRENPNLSLIKVETTEEMLTEIEVQSKKMKYDALIHASAVGDYKSAFTFLMEDMAEEIHEAYVSGKIAGASDILKIMENPGCVLDDSSKISSYQKNLTVKLALTPKIIGRLKEWFPDTLLIGCKLLENVEKDELFSVAKALCEKNRMDYILANDLAELNEGKKTRYVVSKDGFTGTELANTRQIFNFVDNKLMQRML